MQRRAVSANTYPLAGILNVNKPKGWTSFQIVGLVRRLSGIRRVGHGGTLDPLATGVLPVFVGQATRLVEYAQATRKVYLATIHLGAATDTYDAEGVTLQRRDYTDVSREQVVKALSSFLGDIEQRPPPYSAVKQAGVPLYRLARAGQTVAAAARRVTIYQIELLDFAPPLLTLHVECGSGTYIRSLAHDLGQILGCGAYLEGLTRTRVGSLRLEEAVTPDELRAAVEQDGLHSLLLPQDSVLGHIPAIALNSDQEQAVLKGRDIRLSDDFTMSATQCDGSVCRAYSAAGSLIAMLRYREATGRWHPEKVLQ